MGATKRIRVSQMSAGEKSDILEYLSKGKTIAEAAFEFGRDPNTIRKLVADLRPTTALARATLLARSAEIVDKVLDKADVDQLIDVLSRPNMGILENVPTGKGGGNIAIGIGFSVAPGSLPAVNELEFNDGQKRLNAPMEEGAQGGAKRVLMGAQVVGELYNE